MTIAGLLTLTDLVQGLERDGMEYHALDVFASHVLELRGALLHGRLGELQPLDPERPDRAWFGFQRNGTDYQIKVHKLGVAQVTRRWNGVLGPSVEQLAEGALDAVVVRNTEFPGMLLGLLIGEQLGTAPDDPWHILTMRYNEDENRWRAYDGPHARWMRDHAMKIEPAFA